VGWWWWWGGGGRGCRLKARRGGSSVPLGAVCKRMVYAHRHLGAARWRLDGAQATSSTSSFWLRISPGGLAGRGLALIAGYAGRRTQWLSDQA
jgi:hypothetical protein